MLASSVPGSNFILLLKNWLFNGVCFDITGEFMVQVNADNGHRRDRQRWSNYILPAQDAQTCVPSFLVEDSHLLFACGKTIELLQLICPEVSLLCIFMACVCDILLVLDTNVFCFN